MLSNKIHSQVTLIAYATVSNMFATFHNPKMRGDNFNWTKFPDIAESIAEKQVMLGIVIDNKEKQKEAEQLGKKLGREIAVNLIKEMTK